ncbi:MAG: hypothetical protein WBB64_05620 [Anaerolineales bacterium]
MLTHLSNWVQQKSSGWMVMGSLVIMLLFTILVLPAQAKISLENTGGSEIPDTSLLYTPAEIYQMAEIFGPDGRQAYIYARWTFDLVFPLVYVGFLITGISWFLKQLSPTKKVWQFANLFPITAGLFDYLENSAASLVMYLYPAQWTGIALLAAIFSGLKWGLILLSFLGYFCFGAAAFFRWLKRKQ